MQDRPSSSLSGGRLERHVSPSDCILAIDRTGEFSGRIGRGKRSNAPVQVQNPIVRAGRGWSSKRQRVRCENLTNIRQAGVPGVRRVQRSKRQHPPVLMPRYNGRD